MAKTHRSIQQWNRWLQHFPGQYILETEQQALQLLQEYFGKYALLIGVPEQIPLLKQSVMPIQLLVTQLMGNFPDVQCIESEFYKLPIAPGSVDLVMLPHTIECVDNPKQLLAEACRIVKPEGHIIIFGFNPYSYWGMAKMFNGEAFPWTGNFLPAHQIKQWLALSDFELVKHTHLVFRPYLRNQKFFKKLEILEWLGKKCYSPLGGIYLLVAQAKVIPLTPIKLRWQQKLANVGLASPFGISGSPT